MKLQTLKPRIQCANLTRVAPLSVDHEVVRLTGRRLQERNERVLCANPLCVCCAAKGIIRAAVEVDHRIPLHLGGPDSEDNLQGLCKDCHDEKSAQEARDREAGAAVHVAHCQPDGPTVA